MSRFLIDPDGCPCGEVLGYDPDGFPEVDFWGAAGPVLGEADPEDEDEDAPEIGDDEELPPWIPGGDLEDVPGYDPGDSDSGDYTGLFDPPSFEDLCWWANVTAENN